MARYRSEPLVFSLPILLVDLWKEKKKIFTKKFVNKQDHETWLCQTQIPIPISPYQVPLIWIHFHEFQYIFCNFNKFPEMVRDFINCWSLPKIAKDRQKLSKIAKDRQRLPMISKDRWLSPKIAEAWYFCDYENFDKDLRRQWETNLNQGYQTLLCPVVGNCQSIPLWFGYSLIWINNDRRCFPYIYLDVRCRCPC